MNQHSNLNPNPLHFTALALSAMCLVFALQRVARADDWQGPYVGAGIALTDAKLSISKGEGEGSFRNDRDEDPALFGLNAGYTFGLLGERKGNQGFRLGAQFDLAAGDYSEDSTSDDVLGDIEVDGNFSSSLRGRFGYSWDRVWVYATAGLNASDFYAHPKDSDDTHVFLTGVAGIGTEVRLPSNLSIQAELLGIGASETDEMFNGSEREIEVEQTTLRLGLNWRF